MAKCGPNKPCGGGMKLGLFNPFFTGNYANPYSFSGSEALPDQILETFGDDLVLYLPTHRTQAMFREISTVAQVTHADTDTNPVGLIYDLSKNARKCQALGSTRPPALSSGGGRNSFIQFDGSSDFLSVINSQQLLRHIHKTAPVFSIAFWLKVDADGVSYQILANQASTTANNGFLVQRTNANKLNFWVVYGSAGNSMFNFTSTATIVAADGWVPIIITVNGSGVAKGTAIIGSATETFTVGATGSNNDASTNLSIGSNSAGSGSFLDGGLSDIIIVNRVMTADEITFYKAFDPERNDEHFSVLRYDLDLDSAANIYADTARTTPISADAAIALVDSNVTDNFGPKNRSLSQATEALRPLWRDNNINSKAAAEWDGSDDVLVFSEAFEAGGQFTYFVVVKNETADTGSHILTGGAGNTYHVVTGSSYPNNADQNGVAYTVVHPSGGDTSPVDCVHTNDEYNIFAVRRDGSTWDSWNGAKTKRTATDSGTYIVSVQGTPAFVGGWHFNGFETRLIIYSGYRTDAQVEAKIDELNTLYGL